MPSSLHLRDLQRQIAERFPNAVPLAERRAHGVATEVSTGIDALDRALPSGGLPRGKVTVWAPGGGAAAVLRATCRAVIARGERAAWVDASRSTSFGWTSESTPLIVSAPDRRGAFRAAEVLLASGAFGFVVLDTVAGEHPIGTETVRLSRAARDGGGAFVALTPVPSLATLRLSSRLMIRGAGMRWRRDPFGAPAMPVAVRAHVRAQAMGWNASADLTLEIAPYDLRCAVEPGLDRRGEVRADVAASAESHAEGTGDRDGWPHG